MGTAKEPTIDELKAALKAAEDRADAVEAKLEASELMVEELRAKGAAAPAAAAKEVTLTGENTHIATGKGFLAGVLYGEGDGIPAGHPVSTEWMTENDA
jgi:multidrug resistance efflux pump